MMKQHIAVTARRARLAGIACSLAFFLPALVSAQDHPNILFFLSDDQRYDQMGCAGHEFLKTPTMDRLAAGGTRFRNMFVTTSICAASRASILTGLVERTHGFTFGTPPLARKFTDASYPAVLRAAGYRTGFVGKLGVGITKGAREEMFDFFRPLGRSPYFKKQPDGGKRHITQLSADHAIQFLKDQDAEKPFCLSVSFNAPHAEDGDKKDHYPWPKAIDGMYDDVTPPAPRLSDAEIYENQPEFLKKSINRGRYFWRWDTPEKYQKNIKGYWRMISGVDHAMGRVLEQLEKQNVAKNTVVIFAGDNGYYLAQRGFAGKWSHYEESLRVPLIIYDPRLGDDHRGQVNDRVVLNIDIPLTILALAGVDTPGIYQGRDLTPLLKGATPDSWRSDFFCEHLMNVGARIPKWEGVRGQRWVYARYFEQDSQYEFLHDLESDPDQLKNLASDPAHQDQLEKMRARCDHLRDKYGGPYKNPRD